MMRWNDLLAALDQANLRYDRHGAANPEILAITDDSRQVTPGAVFVAYKGVAVDGHRFIPDALRRGAAAIVVERPSADPAGRGVRHHARPRTRGSSRPTDASARPATWPMRS